MFRFFCEDHDDQQLLLSADQAQHLRVIKAKIGQTIEVGDGRGTIFVCQYNLLIVKVLSVKLSASDLFLDRRPP